MLLFLDTLKMLSETQRVVRAIMLGGIALAELANKIINVPFEKKDKVKNVE